MRLTTPWIPPSPNIRRPETVDLYPGLCLIEATNLSEGRGTDQPFHQFGAPWVNAKQLAQRLNASGLQGIRFAPVKFTPSSSKNAGLVCHGVTALVTDPGKFQPVLSGVTVLSVLRAMYPDSLVIRRASLNRLFGVAAAYNAIHKGVPASRIELGWQDGLKEYKELAARFRRYPQQ
jgi:uncharacterized protein YbbC (DUF1343 family)